VKATDEKGKIYQIEIQLAVHAALVARILFTWSSIYHSQIQEGGDYKKLNPVISIWILNGNLFTGTGAYHLCFSLYDKINRLSFTDHLAIHIIQLPEWESEKGVKNEKERWLYLFKKGKDADTDNPPEPLDTEEMRQAMKVLQQFSESEKDYLLYQSRLDGILTYNTWMRDLEDAQKEKEQALEREKQAFREKEQAFREKEQVFREKEQVFREKEQAEKKLRDLLLLLKKKGINPDETVQES
jgi:predicted transposase/invertase (TIGR01784 family)